MGSSTLYTAHVRSIINRSSFTQAEGPKLLQALPAAVGDLYVYRLAKRLFGRNTAQYAVSTIKFQDFDTPVKFAAHIP